MRSAQIVGRLGTDPETKDKYTRLRVAVNRGPKDKRETDWYTVVVFGNLREVCKYMTKGSQVGVDGELSIEKYTGKDDTEKTDVKIIARGLTLCGSLDKADPQSADEPGDSIPF